LVGDGRGAGLHPVRRLIVPPVEGIRGRVYLRFQAAVTILQRGRTRRLGSVVFRGKTQMRQQPLQFAVFDDDRLILSKLRLPYRF